MQRELSKGRKFWIVVLCILFIFTLIFIWGNSIMSSSVSAEESGAVYDTLKPVFDSVFGAGTITEEITRKIAHGTEFFILGLELTIIFALYKNYNFKNWAFILSEGIFIALIDETIQIFTDRGPSIIDVWIDAGGVFAVSLIAGIIGLIVCTAKRKKAAE